MIENNEKLFLPKQPHGLFDNELFGPNEKRCIDLMLILPPSIMKREEIYKMILAPGKTIVTVRAEMRKFLATTNAEQYWMARKHQLEVWKGLVQTEIGEVVGGVEDDVPEDWADKVRKQAIKKALDGHLDDAKASEIVLKEVLKTEDAEDKVIAPIRYLPETCSSCRYKIWVEQIISEGRAEIINDNKNTVEYDTN